MEIPKKHNAVMEWRENNTCFYDFVYENFLDWPVTSVQWGPLLQQNSQFSLQRIYFSCKTDGFYNQSQNNWSNTPNYIIMANVEIPADDHYFINDLKALFNYDSAKKHPNLKVKQVISHPGEITVIRSSPMNRKLLASKSDNNMVFLWTNDKYKLGNANNTANNPDITLLTTKSDKHNYALRFAPSLPKIISASADKLELFDIEATPIKRQLGSVLTSNLIKPLTVLEGHDKVEDISFKNNQICISGGQDQEIGVWDLRVSCMSHKIKDIHADDINAVACKNNYILSGGEDGRVNIIDDRTFKVINKFELQKPIHSLQFNPTTNHFALGRQYLQIYDLERIMQEQTMHPIFTHLGMKGNIHEFDWNTEASMTLATTYQDSQLDISAQGGIIHVFRPLDLFFMRKNQVAKCLQDSYKNMNEDQKDQLKRNIEEESQKSSLS